MPVLMEDVIALFDVRNVRTLSSTGNSFAKLSNYAASLCSNERATVSSICTFVLQVLERCYRTAYRTRRDRHVTAALAHPKLYFLKIPVSCCASARRSPQAHAFYICSQSSYFHVTLFSRCYIKNVEVLHLLR